MAYIQSIENLIATYPDLQSLAGCTPLKHAISDVMQRATMKSNGVSYVLLISAYRKDRREEEALAVFEEMLDVGISIGIQWKNSVKSQKQERIEALVDLDGVVELTSPANPRTVWLSAL
ncbi:pentatricopeptide repeat-containing protein [Tanacetum coccineum]